jgi:hypothetical protein
MMTIQAKSQFKFKYLFPATTIYSSGWMLTSIASDSGDLFHNEGLLRVVASAP